MKARRQVALSAMISLTLAVGCRSDNPVPGAAAGPPAGGAAASATDAAGKRVGPPPVAPLSIDGLRIEAIHWGAERGLGQNGGYIAAFDEVTSEELWTLQIYQIDYDPHLESDVQDIFIERIEGAPSADEIDVIDERGRHFRVDLGSRSVRTVPARE